jgi:GWxTD domain-containing protein
MNCSTTGRGRVRLGNWPLVFGLLFALGSLALSFSSCRLYNLERKLTPEYADFLSKVRYIITREEEKTFLELPDSEKPKFIEEFWKRRNPDPGADVNEFKVEYFKRIDESNQLFFGEGKPGWLTDRGRIYILFGPPLERQTNPMDSAGRCTELWYYPPNFPVLFVDPNCTGNFVLAPINLAHLQELNMAQAQFQRTYKQEKQTFDFSLTVKKTSVTPEAIEGVITIEVPYASVWFKAANHKMEATLDVSLELKNSEGFLFWEYKGPAEISLNESELKGLMGKSYGIEIPFILKQNLDKLRQGKNEIHASIKSRSGEDRSDKVFDFDL